MILQILHVGIALEEPKQFVDDTLQVELLGGEQGESVVEVVTTLGAEDADGSSYFTILKFQGRQRVGEWF